MSATQKYAAAILRAGCLAALAVGCGSSTSSGAAGSLSPASPPAATLMAGWEHQFELDWQVTPEDGGTQRIQGYLVNRNGRRAEPVRVLVQAIDASGAAVGRHITWIPGGVGGFGRSYFEVRHLPSTDRFVVTVWDYSVGREPSSGSSQ
jgi:hypothetical protein